MVEAASPPRIDEIVETADEHRDQPTESPSSLPAPEEVRALFSELRIEPREGGGIRIDASRRAAATLGALFRGMAGLLEQTDA